MRRLAALAIVGSVVVPLDRVQAQLPLNETGADLCATAAFNAGFRGSALTEAVAIGLAESGCNPTAYNGWCCYGIWQIYQSVHQQYSVSCLTQAQCNADAAYDISSGGSNWGPWQTYTNGNYLSHMTEATNAVHRLLPTQTPGVARVASNGEWVFRLTNAQSGTNPSFVTVTFGNEFLGDKPFVGDWNGDGVATPGVARKVNGHLKWYFTNSISGSPAPIHYTITSWGLESDTPIIGDWNFDGKDSPGLARNSTDGMDWFMIDDINASAPATDYTVTNYGITGDTPLAGDWNGDGYDSIGIAREDDTGNIDWKLTNARTGTLPPVHYNVANYGIAFDDPVAGDWNHDGIDSPGVARTDASGRIDWRMTNAVTGTTPASAYVVYDYGLENDTVVVGNWNGT